MTALFRENANLPAERVPRVTSVEPVDVGLVGGFAALAIGLGLVWVPLALIVPGGVVAAVCLWRILR